MAYTYKQHAVIFRTVREDAGLTQDKAAALLDISRRYLQYIEAGERVPRIDLASKMADVYGCSFLLFKVE
jgi:DNA-binding XRE family transcriptional regulator